MRFFYDSNIASSDTKHTLSEEESKHIIRVLRLKLGDRIGVLNGNGSLFECEIIDDHQKRCELSVIQETKEEKPVYDIHIAVGPTKQMDRLEWFIEKATEIGVTEITLIDCQNAERNKIKADRLLKKAISAMKQSHRLYLPKLNELVKVNDFITSHPNGLIAHCYNNERSPMKDVFKHTNCPILIGPEGDFTQSEIETALENGYKTITLGENRLRTETAALFACMNAKLLVG